MDRRFTESPFCKKLHKPAFTVTRNFARRVGSLARWSSGELDLMKGNRMEQHLQAKDHQHRRVTRNFARRVGSLARRSSGELDLRRGSRMEQHLQAQDQRHKRKSRKASRKASIKAKPRRGVSAPPELSELLEKFSKCAIKAQPDDLLKWTKTYFDNLNARKRHSIKEKLKSISLPQISVVTPELLKVLHAHVAGKPTVKSSDLQLIWMRLSLPKEAFDTILAAGHFSDQTEWMKFLALACYCLGKNIATALKLAFEILSTSQRCHPPRIPFSTFQFLYQYLASVDERISPVLIHRSLRYLQQEIIGPHGLIKLSDFMNNPSVTL
ncbi:ropporin-1-like [Lissotriton helveticus]